MEVGYEGGEREKKGRRQKEKTEGLTGNGSGPCVCVDVCGCVCFWVTLNFVTNNLKLHVCP